MWRRRREASSALFASVMPAAPHPKLRLSIEAHSSIMKLIIRRIIQTFRYNTRQCLHIIHITISALSGTPWSAGGFRSLFCPPGNRGMASAAGQGVTPLPPKLRKTPQRRWIGKVYADEAEFNADLAAFRVEQAERRAVMKQRESGGM